MSFYLITRKFLGVGVMANRGRAVVEEDCIRLTELLKISGNGCKKTALTLTLSGARKEIIIRKQDKARGSCFHVFKKLWVLKALPDKSQFL